jgi:TRAP transporter TAXI family solute receptor
MAENRKEVQAMPGERHPATHQLVIFGPAAVAVLVAFVVAYQFIKPAPPDRVVMATGSAEGAYHAFALRYAEALAREGIELELRNTAGSVENLRLLHNGEVGLAFVQGGVGEDRAESSLTSLGSLYYEPLWLFHRADQPLASLRDLSGHRVAVGESGSGTRALASRLLDDNGVGNAGRLDLGGTAAIAALERGEVDAAFLVISAQSPLIADVLRDPAIRLFDFARAPAYTRRYRFLNSVTLPEGAVDLASNIPDRTVRLLAPTANLVSHAELHPAVIDLLLQAANAEHRAGGLLEEPDEFPMPGLLAFPLNKEAERYYEHGPPFLQRFLPFWAASLVDRLKVMLLPLLVLLFPLIKVMPPVYTWRMRARVYRWYDELEDAELRLARGERDAGWVFDELDRIEAEVQRVKVPLSFTDQLYQLRQHIDLVRHQVQTDTG